ncbi:MAG: hypothetical protein ABEH66_04700 [Halobacteriales archaeon]
MTAGSGETPWYDGRVGTLTVVSYVIVTPALMLATAREISLVSVMQPAASWLDLDLAVLGAVLAVVGLASLGSVPGRVKGAIGRGDQGLSVLLSVAAIAGLTVSVYGLPVLVSGTDFAAVSLDTTVPFDVYLYAIVGAAARLSYDFVGDVPELVRRVAGDQPENAPESADSPGAELLRLVVGLPAAVYLAAGIALVSDVTAGAFSWADSATFVAFVGLVAGLFIRRAYGALGDVADRFLASSAGDSDEQGGEDGVGGNQEQGPGAGSEKTGGSSGAGSVQTGGRNEKSILTEMLSRGTPGESGAEPWYTGWRGRLLLVAVFGLVLVVTLVTLEGDPALLNCDDRCVRVPFDIYLYGAMGGLAYVFTTLFVDIERSRRSLVESKFRIVAGLLLAVGAYVLLTPNTEVVAPLAFLVGLYPKVALERLDRAGQAFFDKVSEAARGSR